MMQSFQILFPQKYRLTTLKSDIIIKWKKNERTKQII